jgi:hypothetical protein
MRELYGEGLAIRVGPESCVRVREGVREALTGVRAGWAIEPRNLNEVRGADVVTLAEGDAGSGVIASRCGTPRGLRTCARTESPCARTGRSRDYSSCWDGS